MKTFFENEFLFSSNLVYFFRGFFFKWVFSSLYFGIKLFFQNAETNFKRFIIYRSLKFSQQKYICFIMVSLINFFSKPSFLLWVDACKNFEWTQFKKFYQRQLKFCNCRMKIILTMISVNFQFWDKDFNFSCIQVLLPLFYVLFFRSVF